MENNQNIWLESVPWIDSQNADIDQFLRAKNLRNDFNLYENLIEWRDRGVVVFKDVVPFELIEALESDLEYLIKNYMDFDLMAEVKAVIKPISEFSPFEIVESNVKFNSIHGISKAAVMLSLNRSISQFLACVFDAPPAVLQSLTFFKGSQQPIHIDYPYVRTQKKIAHLAASWIALEDIDLNSGPLIYYPGSHKIEISGFYDWGNGSIVMDADSRREPMDFSRYLEKRVALFGIEPEIFCPKKGDALIWHGNLMHAGSAVNDKNLTRKSYVTHYTSLDSYPDDFKVSDENKFVHQNSGYCFEYPWVINSKKLPSW
ncbi:phytanoyl-CoA dioxygenase family protein [Polynucleobacter sp. AM-26B4]|uniref:phytanoyl-CoA dioxygenase family protein n=1 Tax=Polynucleobacter sp. AM-26B4 TaxID=2689103 RepID=UPI001C0DF58F|nr:phytanoyl-CoA dioxygenase family protein [Polynucleobacter sp. AM-26B4]MBU3585176.1 phytanoyl-CoA dioxygenase family protein [Polynucleobacter sp. AM-26B4]